MDPKSDKVQMHSRTETLAFQHTISWLLAGAGKLVLRRWTEIQSQLDLTSSQHKLVLTLDETGPLGQRQLADLVGIDRRNAVPIIETSVDQGLLIRQVDTTDRRRRTLELTPYGRRIAKRLRRLSAEVEDDLLAPLDSAQRTSLRNALQILLDESETQH